MTNETNIGIGQHVESPEDWNTLPLGATAIDGNGWVHTKTHDCDGDRYETSTYVDNDGGTGTFGKPWEYRLILTSLPEQVVVETSTRPLIDFSQGRYATARRYAAALYNPKRLGPTASATLGLVIDGEKVDAYDLAEAVLYAARSAANRGRSAADRNSLATKAGHLGHIAHSTLQNHADRLPAYEQGVRSRKIETLEGEIEALKAAGRSVTDELDAVVTDLRATKDAAAEYREQADAEVSRLLGDAIERAEWAQSVEDANKGLVTSLEYTLGLLATLDKNACYQALGFMDAYGVEIEV